MITMRKKLVLLTAALLAFVLAFAACGGGDTPSAPAGDSGTTAPANDPAPATNNEPAAGVRNSTLEGLDFGGATIRIGIPWFDGGYAAMIPHFERQFNATVEYVEYGWADYEFLIAQGMGGNPIDIVFGHHAFFPDIIVSGAIVPMDAHILPGDWSVPGVPGGLCRASMDAFNWRGDTFFAASSNSSQIQAMFYNKLLFQEAGLQDPFELYQAGQWTWDRFVQMGAQVTDPANGIYFSGTLNRTHEWMSFTGVPALRIEGVNPVSNIDSPEFFAMIEAYRNIVFGSGALSPTDGDQQLLGAGTVFMSRHIAEYWDNIANNIASNSSAFGMTDANLGMVPVPIHPLQPAGQYPGMSSMGWGIGLGSNHPQAAVAWALLEASLPLRGNFPSQAHADAFANIAANNTIFNAPSGFSDSGGAGLMSMINPIFHAAAEGGDIASAIAAARPEVQRLIADTIAAMGN
jgi:ABC-type glycerol-3-phosphate transport system substrate-binding protein